MSAYALSRNYFSFSAPEEKQYQHIMVKPASLALGAYVSDVDLSKPRKPEVYAEIADALWRHHVLFFRDQALTPEGHIAFARHFGDLEVHEVFMSDPNHPEISILENDAKNPPEVNLWHTDVTFRKEPSLCSILHGVEVPETGSDTLWINQRLAFDTLSDPWKEFLLGLEAEHDVMSAYAGTELLERAGGDKKAAELKRDHPPITHPVIVAHPITGKASLFVSPGYTTRIMGMSKVESDAVLNMLFAHQQKAEFQVRFKWEADSIAMWDNFSTMHYALADYYPMHRKMRRMTVAGKEPVAAVATT